MATLQLAQAAEEAAPGDHVMNVLRKGKSVANVGNRVLEEFPVLWRRLMIQPGLVGDLRNHEAIHESRVQIVDPDHLAKRRKRVVMTQAHVEVLESRALWL